MRRTDQVGGLVLLVFAIAFSATAARHYPYWGANGPGSGFLPFWLGVAMAVLAVLLFIGATRSRVAGDPWLPRGHGLARLIVVLLATAVFIALLKVLGMVLGGALFLVTLLRFVERHSWRLTLGVAAGSGVLNYLVFTYWLRVPFPEGPLGF
jgi:hypothetical protein